MPPAEQITLLAETLAIPHARLEPRALIIDDAASDQEVVNVALRLVAVAGHSQWALASAMFTLLDRKGESWLNEFCCAAGIHPKVRRELLAVHTFYPRESRTHALTYQHYRDAMLIVNDGKPKALQRATRHLADAQANGWTVSELRKHTRTAEATEKPAPKQDEFASYEAVHAFARYARHELPSLSTWSAERVSVVLADLSDAIEFIDRLRAIKQLKSKQR